MKIVRLYSGNDGQSHFEEIGVALEPRLEPRDGSATSAVQATAGVLFRRAPAGHTIGWHNAPRHQYLIMLSGGLEIEIGDGTVRRFGPGDVLLAEDLTGQGHLARGVGDVPREQVFVPLAD